VLTLLLGAASLTAVPGTARADEPEPTVYELITRAHEQFLADDFVGARETLLRVETALPEAGLAPREARRVEVTILRAIARCHERTGQLGPAITYYDRFLALADPKARKLRRLVNEARKARAELQAQLDRAIRTPLYGLLGDAFTDFRAQRFDEALGKLLRGEELLRDAPLPEREVRHLAAKIHHAIGRCYDQTGRVESALERYARFFEPVDPEAPGMAELIEDVRDAQVRLRGLLERTAISFEVEPEGAEVTLDGEALGNAPAEPRKVAPGRHLVRVQAEGYEPAELELEVEAGNVAPLVVKLNEVPTVVVQEAPFPWLYVVGGTVGVAALAAGVGALVFIRDEHRDVVVQELVFRQ